MLGEDEFTKTLARLKSLFDAGHLEEAGAAAQRLRLDLLEDLPIEPSQLGWARHYAFRSLYGMQKFEEAYQLLNHKERHIFILPATQAAETYLLAAELVVRLGRPASELVKWGQKALDLRLASGELPAAVDVCNSVCTFLGILEEDQLNTRYAEWLLETGIEYKADRLVIGGVAHLLRNPLLQRDPQISAKLDQRHDVIERAFNGPFKDESRNIYREYLEYRNQAQAA